MEEITGVCLLLFASIGGVPKMYSVEELKAKPEIFKETGMVGPPFETMEDEDQGVKGTLLRLIKEETPFSTNAIIIHGVIPDRFKLIPGRNNIYTRYAYATFRGNLDKIGGPADNDIQFAGWYSVAELANKFIRIETGPILEHFERHGHYAKLRHLL